MAKEFFEQNAADRREDMADLECSMTPVKPHGIAHVCFVKEDKEEDEDDKEEQATGIF